MVGNLPVGAAGTSLHMLGYKFSHNSSITFLLDNQPLTGMPDVHSDENGNFQADLPVTSTWSIGMHRLTARDSGSYLAINVSNMRIVNQGEANTPGPHGAPADDGAFLLKITMKQTNSSSNPTTELLTVMTQSGHVTVCDEQSDTDQQLTYNGNLQGGVSYKETDTYSCQGAYKGGQLSYTEMLDSSKVSFSNGVQCGLHLPSYT